MYAVIDMFLLAPLFERPTDCSMKEMSYVVDCVSNTHTRHVKSSQVWTFIVSAKLAEISCMNWTELEQIGFCFVSDINALLTEIQFCVYAGKDQLLPDVGIKLGKTKIPEYIRAVSRIFSFTSHCLRCALARNNVAVWTPTNSVKALKAWEMAW